MRRITLLSLILTALVSTDVISQKKVPSHVSEFVTKKVTTVCRASDEVSHHYVPAKKRVKNLKNPLQIIPQFSDNVPRGVQDLISNGLVPILSNTFSSPQPVRVAFFWRDDVGEGTLAGARPATLYRNIPANMNGAALPLTNIWYPVALAEKILNRQINEPNDPDIIVTINSKADWYTVYQQPENIGTKYDLLSTLLHEIYHGLGFLSNSNVENGNGTILFNGALDMYTHNIVNSDGVFIKDFSNGSSQLGAQLLGNALFFRINNDETRQPKLYAPRTWERGSSISHIDEFKYSNTENSLMTPSSARGEVERSAGLADEMMYDMGWKHTSILHTQAEPVENVNEPYNLSVEVLSDEGLQDGIVFMHYTTDGFTSTQSVPMNDDGNGMYSSTIPATGKEQVVNYYFSTKDKTGKEYVSPGQAPTYSFQYVFAIDDSIPTITHTAAGAVKSVDVSFDVTADISDFFTGVDTAYVEYKVNDGGLGSVGMTLMALDSFSPPVYFSSVPLPSGLSESDKVEYRIVAIDKSAAKNQATYPVDGSFLSVPVSNVAETVDKYYNSFFAQESDFVLDGFTQERLAGWGTEALHTAHPYPNAGQDNAFNFTAELQIPIRVASEDPLLIFEEVVLVENGDAGAAFGTTEFWDYVVVEAKKLGTSDWLPLIEGYDCRANPVWLNTYVGGIPTGQQNSTGVGTEAMLRKRTINMTETGHFKAGDEILIRFRMLSDPFATGWGWAIDNLSIQDKTTAVEDYVADDKFTLLPNPATDDVTISLSLEKSVPNANISIVDMLGNIHMTQTLRTKSKQISKKIDISSLPSGVYFVQIAFNDKDVISKRLVKTE